MELELAEYLCFCSAGLTEVCESLGGVLQALQELDLSDNQLTSIAPLGHCPLLTKLNVASNNITTLLDIKQGSFRALEWLDVSYNLVSVCSVFSSASVIGRLPNLKCLKAAGNELCHVPSLLGLFPQLKELRLEHNSLRERDLEQLVSLRNLRWLNLAQNKIRTVPETVAQCRTFAKLISLDLGDGSCPTNKKTSRGRLQESFKEFQFQSVASGSRKKTAKHNAKTVDHNSHVPAQESPEKESETEDALVSAVSDKNVAEAELSDLDPRWKEIEDPTTKLALQLGLHPSFLGRPSKEAQNAQALSMMLQQVLSRESYLETCTRNPCHYRRLTFSCFRKLEYKTHIEQWISN